MRSLQKKLLKMISVNMHLHESESWKPASATLEELILA